MPVPPHGLAHATDVLTHLVALKLQLRQTVVVVVEDAVDAGEAVRVLGSLVAVVAVPTRAVYVYLYVHG